MGSDNIKQRKILPQGPLKQYGSEELIPKQKLSFWIHENKGQVINKREGGQLHNWNIVCQKLVLPSLK